MKLNLITSIMHYRYRFIYSGFLFLLITLGACRSFDSISEDRDKLERSKAVYLLDTAQRDVLEISYDQGGVDMSLRLFLSEHEFEMEFDKNPGDGMNVATTSLAKSQIKTSDGRALPSKSAGSLKSDMSKVIYAYNLAQTRFYNKDYEGSLASLDSSLAIMPTSDAYALKGSILFVLKEYDLAQYYWSEAKKLNPEFVIPQVIRK